MIRFRTITTFILVQSLILIDCAYASSARSRYISVMSTPDLTATIAKNHDQYSAAGNTLIQSLGASGTTFTADTADSTPPASDDDTGASGLRTLTGAGSPTGGQCPPPGSTGDVAALSSDGTPGGVNARVNQMMCPSNLRTNTQSFCSCIAAKTRENNDLYPPLTDVELGIMKNELEVAWVREKMKGVLARSRRIGGNITKLFSSVHLVGGLRERAK